MVKVAAGVAGLALAGLGAWMAVAARPPSSGEACSDPPKDGTAPCCDTDAGAPGPPQDVRVLDASTIALRDDFNAHADRWRAVLLVSPVCSECVLGARAVEREIMARYPPEQLHASVVWIPMLKGDTEDAARASSGILARPNAAHFYDAKQAAGWAWHRGPFEGMARRIKAALPADHWITEAWAQHREDTPQWDLYMLYAPGVKWDGGPGGEKGDKGEKGETQAPPTPTAWIRHIGRCGQEEKSVYWRDTPDTPPREGDLYDAMRTMADETIGKPDQGAQGGAALPTIELLGFPDCPNTPTIRANLKAALESLGPPWTFTDVNQQALPADDLRRGYPTPTILVNGRDLFGLARPTEPTMSCREYPGGVPDAPQIKAKIKAVAP